MTKLLFSWAALTLATAALAADPAIVGGERVGATSATSMMATATMAGGTLSITLTGVEGTDSRGVGMVAKAPDGATVCLKANGQQSADWRGGTKLGSIKVGADTCAYGYGTINDGQVTLVVAKEVACPAGRTQAMAVMSGVLTLADGKQWWVPHPGAYRVFAKGGKDATAIAFDCATNTAAPLDGAQAKMVASLI